MNTQTINISLPRDLVTLIDQHAKKDFSSRSEYIRTTLLNRVRNEEKAGLHPEILEIAKKIADRYDQDFKNLANR